MDNVAKNTKYKWILMLATFLLWSMIYTLLTFYKQPNPDSNTNVWDKREMEVNVSVTSPVSSTGNR